MYASVIISFIFVGFIVAYMLGTYARYTIGFFKSFNNSYDKD